MWLLLSLSRYMRSKLSIRVLMTLNELISIKVSVFISVQGYQRIKVCHYGVVIRGTAFIGLSSCSELNLCLVVGCFFLSIYIWEHHDINFIFENTCKDLWTTIVAWVMTRIIVKIFLQDHWMILRLQLLIMQTKSSWFV